MNTIALEDLVTLVCTEFVKIEQHNALRKTYDYEKDRYITPYLKMNMSKRRKISEKILSELGKSV